MLLFVGLASVDVSILRVQTRVSKGGHGVPLEKLKARFPRTQKAVGIAVAVADMAIMFDNSLSLGRAFSLARVQKQGDSLFDCRNPGYAVDEDVRSVATLWLDKVVGPYQ